MLETEPIVNNYKPIPVILGHPFLATANALINYRNGIMNLSFRNMTLELNVFNMCKQLYDKDNEIENFELIESIMEEQNLGSLSNLMHICSSDDLLEFDIANDSPLLDLYRYLKTMKKHKVLKNWEHWRKKRYEKRHPR